MYAAPHITNAEELWDAGDIGRCELVRGELLMMSPAEEEHGRVANNFRKLVCGKSVF